MFIMGFLLVFHVIGVRSQHMKICIFGAGYVGLVAAACFAESGNTVIAVDVDEAKIAGLKQGIIPIMIPSGVS